MGLLNTSFMAAVWVFASMFSREANQGGEGGGGWALLDKLMPIHP